VLHPDHWDALLASFLHQTANICDDGVSLVSTFNDAVLHVDDEQCDIRSVL
jgi:hypothetical protein